MNLSTLKETLSKRKKPLLIGTACLLVAAVGGYYVFTTFAPRSANAKAMNSTMNQYKEITVSRGDILVGVTEAGSVQVETTEVTFDYATTILDVYVSAGEVVSEGTPLVQVDTDTANTLYSEAQDALSSAKTALENANMTAETKELAALEAYYDDIYHGENATTIRNNAVAAIDNDYAELQAELQTLETSLAALQANEARYMQLISAYPAQYETLDASIEALAQSGADDALLALLKELKTLDDEQKQKGYPTLIATTESERTKKELELSNFAAQMATKRLAVSAQYDQTMIDYNNAQTVYDNAIAAIANDVASAQALVDSCTEALAEYAEISETGILYAPSNGSIMNILSIGDEVKANSTIASISGSKTVHLLVSIAQDDISDITVGMEAVALLDAYDEYNLPAQVESISISASSAMSTSVNYTVSVMCNIAQYGLTVYEGMTADVTFIQQQATDVLMLSNTCIHNTNGKQTVTVLQADGSLQTVEITTGFSDGFDTEITSGLTEGDIVILESAVM